MKDAQKPDHMGLNTLVNRLKEGRYVIPDFQREFEWQPWDIRELLKSIFLDYYIGSLLLWKGKKENFTALSCEPIRGHKNTDNQEFIVLDGQQRLTAIYYAFLSPDIPLPKKANRASYFIRVDKFMNEEYDEAFDYEWLTTKWGKVSKKGKSLSKWGRKFQDKEAQYEEHIFPLALIGSGSWDLFEWVKGYSEYWKKKSEDSREDSDRHYKNALEFGEQLKEITEQYQIAYVELDKDLPIEKVCDIFTQINSRGVRLDVFDLINALLTPRGLKLKHMWRESAKRLEFVETDKMNVYILQVMSILRQAYCSPKYLYFLLPGQEKTVRNSEGNSRKEILVKDAADFENLWNNATDSLEKAINLLNHPQEYGAISSKHLPYVSILPVFSALQSKSSNLEANKRLDAKRKIRYWYWASVFTNRYSGSVESTSARDYLDVVEWFGDDSAEPGLISEFKERLRTLDLRKESKRGTSVYSGIFNLLVLQGAKDWTTGEIPQHNDLDDHHIIPASWGSDNLEGNSIHSILNRSPLSSDTNRNVINDRLPNEYLPQMIKDNGEKVVSAIMESHFISPKAQDILMRNPFTPDDYEQFMNERQKTLREAIENLLIKERLDLNPVLREMDEQIEAVELSIRELIRENLENNDVEIPQHVQQRLNERIQRASQKNAAMDLSYYETLKGMLEYCDMRELQDIITGKTMWMLFEGVFSNKEALLNKFNQLAEVRNGIRHSRSIDQITQKEGEAAILWFKEVLKG